MGASQSFTGRVRLGVESQFRWVNSGVPRVSEIQITEQRATLEVAWAPMSQLFLLARMPFVRREVAFSDLSTATLAQIGDMEISGRWNFFQDRRFRPRNIFFLSGGIELPTAPELSGPENRSLGFEAQVGSGSFDPLVGLGHIYSKDRLSIYTNTRWLLPTDGRFGARSGIAFLASSMLQGQLHSQWAVRGGVDLRWESPIVDDGLEDPHSGGTGIFLTPDVIWSPLTDLVLRAAVSIPVLLDLRGEQAEGLTVRIGVVIDV